MKEDLEAMIHVLTPVLYLTKTGVPKPPFLDPSIIQQLTNKVYILFFSIKIIKELSLFVVAWNVGYITIVWLYS